METTIFSHAARMRSYSDAALQTGHFVCYEGSVSPKFGVQTAGSEVVGAVYDRAVFAAGPAQLFLKRRHPIATPQRLRWLFTEHPLYYITACTHNRRRILDRPAVHDAFIQFGLRAPACRVSVGRYVIMPDHIHLFVGFGTESTSVSAWMKSFKNAISKTLTNADFRGPHWQKGFFDHLIRSQESYDEKWRYVRDNPVRAGLVRSAEDWPYAGEISDLPY